MKTIGLIAAPPTGFQSDGSIDLAVVPHLARHLHAQGVSGVFINGTTGEGMSLSIDEREVLAEAWKKALPAGMTLFVHVGCHSLPEARRMTAHSQAIGANAVASLAPGFFRPEGIAGVVEWCASLAEAAPELPFYFYHMPSMNGVHLRASAFLEAAEDRIPNLGGVKFTFEAMDDFLMCQQQACGKFDVLWGRDEMLLGALAMGARGGVGSTYNIMTPLYLRLIGAFQQGDFEQARRLQIKAIEVIQAMVATGNFFTALKVLLAKQGVPIESSVRIPQSQAIRMEAIDAIPHILKDLS